MWSNCIQFKLALQIGNEDRENLDNSAGYGIKDIVAGQVTPVSSIQFEIVPRSQQPEGYCQSISQYPVSTCLGQEHLVGVPGSGCDSTNIGQKMSPYSIYSTSGIASNPSKTVNDATYHQEVIAGYKTQLRRCMVSTRATDDPNAGFPAGGDRSPITQQYEPAGEWLYTHLKSYGRNSTNGLASQCFCVWVCPVGQKTCAKQDMIRLKPHINASQNMFTSQPNGEYCSPAEMQVLGKCDSTGRKVDPMGRSTALKGCPSFNSNDPSNSCGYEYSFRSQEKSSTLLDTHNLMVEYPRAQTEDDFLEVTTCSKADADSSQWPCVSYDVHVRIRPALSFHTLEFAASPESSYGHCFNNSNAEWCCDPDQPSLPCNQGKLGLPLNDATMVYDITQPHQIAVDLTQEKLHGDRVKCRAAVGTSVTDPAAAGSNSTRFDECGYSAFVAFMDETAKNRHNIVQTVKVELGVHTIASCQGAAPGTQCRGMTASEIAQSVAIMETSYSRSATDASTGVVMDTGLFVLAATQELLWCLYDSSAQTVFDANNPSTAIAVTSSRIITTRCVESEYPTRFLKFSAGTPFAKHKAWFIAGKDESPNSPDDFSLQNNQCGPNLQFTASLSPASGYPPIVKNDAADSIVFTAINKNIFGQFKIGCMQPVAQTQYVQVIDTDSTNTNAASRHPQLGVDGHCTASVVEVGAWEKSASVPNTPNSSVAFWVAREKSTAETLNDNTNSPLKSATLKMKLHVANSFNSHQYKVCYQQMYGTGAAIPGHTEECIEGTALQAANGVFEYTWPACTPGAAGTVDCASVYGNATLRGQCTCASSMPAGESSVAFQWLKVSFKSKSGSGSCSLSSQPEVRLSIEEAVYPSQANLGYEDAFKGKVLNCPVEENPGGAYTGINLASSSSAVIMFSTNVTADNIFQRDPNTVKLCGLDASTGTTRHRLQRLLWTERHQHRPFQRPEHVLHYHRNRPHNPAAKIAQGQPRQQSARQ